jgi:hypothetical protein
VRGFEQVAALFVIVVVLLVSDDANWITGQNIRVNGGTI